MFVLFRKQKFHPSRPLASLPCSFNNYIHWLGVYKSGILNSNGANCNLENGSKGGESGMNVSPVLANILLL